jgi:hypothetical protein
LTSWRAGIVVLTLAVVATGLASSAAARRAPSAVTWSWIPFEQANYSSSQSAPLDITLASEDVLDHPGSVADPLAKTDGIETRLRLLIIGPSPTIGATIHANGTQTCANDRTKVTRDYSFAVKPGKSLLLPRSSVKDPPFKRLTASTVTCSWAFDISLPSTVKGTQPVTVELSAFAPKYVLGIGGRLYDREDCTIVGGPSSNRRSCHPLGEALPPVTGTAPSPASPVTAFSGDRTILSSFKLDHGSGPPTWTTTVPVNATLVVKNGKGTVVTKLTAPAENSSAALTWMTSANVIVPTGSITIPPAPSPASTYTATLTLVALSEPGDQPTSRTVAAQWTYFVID